MQALERTQITGRPSVRARKWEILMEAYKDRWFVPVTDESQKADFCRETGESAGNTAVVFAGLSSHLLIVCRLLGVRARN